MSEIPGQPQQTLHPWPARQPGWVPAPPQQNKGLPGWAIALMIGGTILVVLCGVGAVLFALNVNLAPQPTVRLTSCTTKAPVTTIGYVVRNNDKVIHDYYVQGTVGGSAATPSTLKRILPGETAAGRLDSFGQGECRVTRVDQR